MGGDSVGSNYPKESHSTDGESGRESDIPRKTASEQLEQLIYYFFDLLAYEYKWSHAEIMDMYLYDIIGYIEALYNRKKKQEEEKLTMKRIDLLIEHDPERAIKILNKEE